MPEARTFLRPDGRRFVLGLPDGELPPGELFASVEERDADHLRTLEDLGFVRQRRELHLVLPTDVPRLAAPAGIEAVRADAVDEETLRLLDDELRQDVPGTDGWHWTANGFHEETFLSPHFDPAAYMVARYEGAYVGICRVWIRPEHPRLGFIGVRRSLRRCGIARWLIGETFAVLRARGEREVWTELDEANVASRRLLENLGARPAGASLELKRRSGTSSSPGQVRRRTWGVPRSRT
jgi:ribosomal protein S18 acetylase RimI-like enzyme